MPSPDIAIPTRFREPGPGQEPAPGNVPPGIGGKARALLELETAGFPVPPFLCSPTDLAAAVRQLGTPLVVRSSASVEDGAAASFAGQFRSFLNLTSVEEVRAAVDLCLASIHTPAVKEYCRSQGFSPANLSMGYIVQRMIRPELAGVAFTVDPVTGREEVVIEACQGLADDLLSGRQPPLSPNHELIRRYTPAIIALARRIHRHFGAPQDIEFAIEQGTLYVLQARPITRIDFAPETGVWTNADFRDGGVSSTVCTPLMWSLYDYIWEHTLKGFLREIKLLHRDFPAGRMFFGRPYWNLGAVKQCLATLPGFNERKFDEDLSVQRPATEHGVSTPVTLAGVLRALPTILAVHSVWRKQKRFDRAFMAGGFECLVRPYETVGDRPTDALRSLIEHAYLITESNYFRTIYCASLARMDFTDSFPDCHDPRLVGGLPQLQHFAPLAALRQMRTDGALNFETFLRRFRHHSRRELDIRTPRWDEDPDWVRTLLDRCEEPTGFDARSEFEEARREALRRLPWHQRRAFHRKLNRLRTFLWLREEMRDVSSRIYYLLRRQVLAIAQQRGLGDDIFFMTYPEILEDDRSQIDQRRAYYDSYRNFKAPNEIGAGYRTGSPASATALRGLIASRGVVQGTARIARCIEDAAGVERGAILVCPFTDPGWTPVLSRVAGVITETGGLLSHAAIICREYGIPALLGVPDATNRIPNGAKIVLRADAGFVELLSTNPSDPLNPS